jgi:hypothetical protein
LGSEEKVLAKYMKPDLLIIDDMGMKQLPKRSGEYLFEIIMRRYETRSTMMTSNRPLEDWGKLVGDVPSATAILDRFLHHATIIAITGRSYRLRHQGRASEMAVAASNTANAPLGSAEGDEDSNAANAPLGSESKNEQKGRGLEGEETTQTAPTEMKTHRTAPAGSRKPKRGAAATT